MDPEALGQIFDEMRQRQDGDTEQTPSVRLKSALKTHQDYLKNKKAKKRKDELEHQLDMMVLEDSTVVLSKMWDKVKLEETGAFKNFVDSSFPQYDQHQCEIFNAELRGLCGMENPQYCDMTFMSTLFGKISEITPNLLSLYVFFSFVVTINWDQRNVDPGYAWPVEHGTEGILWTRYDSRLTVGIYDMWCLLSTNAGRWLLLHRDHLLNITDKLGERLNILLFSTISGKTNKITPPSINILMALFEWGDTIVSCFASKGFELLSNYEAIVVGIILSKGDDDLWDVHKFLNNVLIDIKDDTPWAYDYAIQLVSMLSPLTVDQLCDVHGLYRIWGHPEVQLFEGLKKMYNVSTAEKEIDMSAVVISGRMFKEIFFLNYRRKHKHYPNFEVTVKPDETLDDLLLIDYLIKCLESNEEIRIDESRYDLESWDRVIIKKNFEIPYSWNLAHNIKDKAISPDRSELKSSIRRGLGAIWQDARRTVLKWLSMDVLSMRDFLQMIDIHGMPEKYLIIGLYAKERELKYYPRFFSLMSFYLRLYTVSTEHLISENLLPYFPQITMTSDLLTMTKKILKMSGKMSKSKKSNEDQERKKRSVSYSINIDFKKWNQQMRYEITEPVFRCIDDSFGFNNVIRRTHQFFRKAYIYLCSGEYMPQLSGDDFIIQPPWSWENDGSGKEGLRQKGWTIMTVCMIEYIMRKHTAKSELIGGGDNQVLVITIETEALKDDGTITQEGKIELKGKMKRILQDLDNFFTSVGLPLKINETWVSSELFMYNKIMCYQGMTLRSCLKVASRSFPFSDDAAITIHGILSTLGTSVKSLCSKDFTHIPAYIFSRWLVLIASYLIFYFHPLIPGGLSRLAKIRTKYGKQGTWITIQPSQSELNLKALTMRCLFYFRVMGGYAIGVPSEWVMRGFPDPLTEAISWIIKCVKNISHTNKYRTLLLSFISMSKKPGSPSYLHLVSDPVSINHDGPAHGLAKLREEAENAIVKSGYVKNKNFKEIAQVCYSKNSEDLLSSMCSSNMLEPKFLHDIFSATLYGYFNSIVSKVDKSTTITRLNKKSGVMNEVRTAEAEYLVYSLIRANYPYDYTPQSCSRITAEVYRTSSWGKPIVGVTVPCPTEIFPAPKEINHPDCDENFILLSALDHPKQERPYGPMEPYLGSFTDEKFKLSPIAGAFGDEALLKKAIHIQKLRHWRYPEGTDLYNLIETVLRSECDLDPDSVFILCSSASSATHRYSGEVLSHGAIMNANPDAYRYFAMTTSTLTKRSRGGRNDMIHFQACLLWISSMMVNMSISTRDIVGSYHFHEECDTCIVPVYEVANEDGELSHSPQVPTMPENDLAYVKSVNIQLSYADRILINKYNALQCQMSVTDVADKEDLIHDSLAQGIFILLHGKRCLTGSQVNRILLRVDPYPVFCRLKCLLETKEVLYQDTKAPQYKRLDPLFSNFNFIRFLKNIGLSVPRKFISKRSISCELLIPAVLRKCRAEKPNYLTTLDIDPLMIQFSICYMNDIALRTCERCQDEVKRIATLGVLSQETGYKCQYHVVRYFDPLKFVPTDPYGISKEGSFSYIIKRNTTECEIKPSTIRVLPRFQNKAPPDVKPYSNMGEIISGSEISSLCYMLIWLLEKNRDTTWYILTDADWNILFLIVHIMKSYNIIGKIVSKLDDGSNSGSEFNNLIGFRECLYEDDKKYIMVENPTMEDIQLESSVVQIVTYRTECVYDVQYILFPSTSLLCYSRVLGMIFMGREMYYPSSAVDRANWCVAERTSGTGCDVAVLLGMRGHFKRYDKRNSIKMVLELFMDKSIYPIKSENSMAQGLSEIEIYKLPSSKLQIVYNAQVLANLLHGKPISRSNLVEGKYRYYCHGFIIMIALCLPRFKAARLIKGLQNYRYLPEHKTLVLMRKSGSNALLVDTYQYMREEHPLMKVPLIVSGYNRVFLDMHPPEDRGIHLYGIK